MNKGIEKIAKQALGLPSSARAYLAELLLESLDTEEDFPVSAEELEDIRLRCEEIDTGKVVLIEGEAALAGIRKRYEAV